MQVGFKSGRRIYVFLLGMSLIARSQHWHQAVGDSPSSATTEGYLGELDPSHMITVIASDWLSRWSFNLVSEDEKIHYLLSFLEDMSEKKNLLKKYRLTNSEVEVV